MTRTCLIVSPYFPPSTLAGVHRARLLARRLPEAGWTPVVVCVDESFHEERLDPGLAALVPPSVEIVKVGAISARLARPLGFGDLGLRACLQLRRAIFGLLETRAIDAVLVTGSPYYPMLLAGEIKRRFGVPVVLDFQDPWVSAWGAEQPRFSKSGLAHALSVWLEPRAVRAADFITSVSAIQNDEMAARYPWLDKTRMAAIPIGGDDDDYEALRNATFPSDGGGLEKGCVNFCYAGTIWPPVIGTLKTFLRAMALLRDRHPAVFARVRLRFIGTTANPNDTTGYRVLPLAEAAGVADIVRETPQRLPYLQALSIQANSEGALIFGSAEPHYTASKIFSILMSRRPFLSILHKASSAHEILTRSGGGIALSFGSPDELSALEGPLADAIATIATDPASLGRADPAVYAAYHARAISARYAAIFERLAARRVGVS